MNGNPAGALLIFNPCSRRVDTTESYCSTSSNLRPLLAQGGPKYSHDLGICKPSTPARAGWTQRRGRHCAGPGFNPCSRRVDERAPISPTLLVLQPLLAQGGHLRCPSWTCLVASTPARAGWTICVTVTSFTSSFNPCSRRVDHKEGKRAVDGFLQPLLAQGGRDAAPRSGCWRPFNPCSRRVDRAWCTENPSIFLQPLHVQGRL